MNGCKKKIVYIITKSNWGGAQRYVYDLTTNLPRTEFDPIVVCGGKGDLVRRLNKAGVRVLEIQGFQRDISLKKEFQAFFELLSFFRQERPSVVHLNSPKAGGLGALAARISRVPRIIFTVHGWAWNEVRPRYQKNSIKFFSWLTVLLAHETIAVSKSDAIEMCGMPYVKTKIRVIHNGISDTTPMLSRLDARAKLALPLQTTIIGTIAELHRNKGLSVGINAIEMLKELNVTWCIIGEGDNYEHLHKQIKNLPVILAGKHENAIKLLLAFDVFLLPSLKEGLPYVILEAGAAGLPVVATEVGGIPEIIEDGVSGVLAPPRDPQGLAGALAKLIADPALARQMGEALKKTIAEQFSLDRMVRETIAIYKRK